MLLSVSCTYGIQAVIYLATVNPEGFTPIRTISDELGLSKDFLAKVLQRLKEADIITSRRGPKGGVALVRSAEELTLKELILAVDGDELFTACVLGLPNCATDTPCPLHDQWCDVRGRLESMFDELDVDAATGCIATPHKPPV